MNPIIIQMTGYFIVFVMTVLFLNYLSANFLFTFLRVRASRGSLVLIGLDGLTNTTFKSGKLDGNMLKFKSPSKKKKTVLVSREDFGKTLGVNSIYIDDETNAVRKPDYTAAPEFDSEQYDNLLVRAETAPVLEDKTDRIIMIIAIVINIAGLFYLGYTLNIIKGLVLALQTTGVIG